MIDANRLRDLLEQNRLPDPRRGDDQAALPAPERGEQIDRAHTDGIDRIVLQHDAAFGVERRQIVERRRRLPFVGRLAFDREDAIEHQGPFSRSRGARIVPASACPGRRPNCRMR